MLSVHAKWHSQSNSVFSYPIRSSNVRLGEGVDADFKGSCRTLIQPLYAAKYPHRRRPSVKMFSTLFQPVFEVQRILYPKVAGTGNVGNDMNTAKTNTGTEVNRCHTNNSTEGADNSDAGQLAASSECTKETVSKSQHNPTPRGSTTNSNNQTQDWNKMEEKIMEKITQNMNQMMETVTKTLQSLIKEMESQLQTPNTQQRPSSMKEGPTPRSRWSKSRPRRRRHMNRTQRRVEKFLPMDNRHPKRREATYGAEQNTDRSRTRRWRASSLSLIHI
ncbi:hypothetical protein C0J52_25069 [Blattella germanica]|nr:hypothetical protein C0J52_25069 [Blattella germanica]